MAKQNLKLDLSANSPALRQSTEHSGEQIGLIRLALPGILAPHRHLPGMVTPQSWRCRGLEKWELILK